jgi:hypothetical protein
MLMLCMVNLYIRVWGKRGGGRGAGVGVNGVVD